VNSKNDPLGSLRFESLEYVVGHFQVEFSGLQKGRRQQAEVGVRSWQSSGAWQRRFLENQVLALEHFQVGSVVADGLEPLSPANGQE